MKASDYIYTAFRLAGVLGNAGRGASTAEVTDGLSALNRMVDSWSVDRLSLPGLLAASYDLTAGKGSYTIGASGDFNAIRPQRIERANIILSSGIRESVDIISDQEWAGIAIQDLQGIPERLYLAPGAPLSTIYLWPVPSTSYGLELYTWQTIERFASADTDVVFPRGYEEAVIYNLAVRLHSLFPERGLMSPEVPEIAIRSKADLQSFNSPAPLMRCDSAVMGGHSVFNIYTGE